MLAAIPVLLGLALTSQAPPPPQAKAVKRSLASTTWPVEPSLRAGFLISREAFAPFAGVDVFVPVLPGVGPAAVVRVTGLQIGELGVVEGFAGAGPAFETNFGNLRGRLTVAGGALLHGFRFGDGDDGGVSVGPAAVVPLTVGLPLGSGVSFDLTIEPGLARSVTHLVDGQVAWSRDRVFCFVGAGVNFGGPPD